LLTAKHQHFVIIFKGGVLWLVNTRQENGRKKASADGKLERRD
jgi:hypothetical protein